MSPYSVVSPVSPLKKTPWRWERTTNDDQRVALRVFSVRPEKCCDGAAVIPHTAPRQVVRLPPVELSDAPRIDAPCLEVGADTQRGHERYLALRERADRGVVEMVVVVVGDDDKVTGGMARSATGTGWNRLGPASRRGEARGPHTGSVSTRTPSISMTTVEWPSQVTRRPLSGRRRHAVQRIECGQRPCGDAPFLAAEKIRPRGHGSSRVAQARQDRMPVAETLPRPAR